jgi:hypothetical protein
MASSELQNEKALGQVGDEDFELSPWGMVIIPHEVAFISDRGKIRVLPLRPDLEKPTPVSLRE